MRIIHVTADIGFASFGIGPVVLQIARAQIRLGQQVSVWATSTEEDAAWAAATNGIDPATIQRFRQRGPSRLVWSPSMEHAATLTAQSDVAVVHQHSLWSAVSRVTDKLRRAHQTHSIIAPHGTLQSWALQRSRVKKRIVSIAYEAENLHAASCFHAVAESEIADIRSYGLSAPIAVIPNGISEDWIQSTGDMHRFREAFALPDDRRIMLFLSRITPKKGLPMLLRAIQACGKHFDDWLLIIGGADEFDHLAEIEELVKQLELAQSVKLVGPLYDQIKRDAFAAAEIFVLPSLSEGAPVVILEALGATVPVLATKASPWQDLLSHGCGWWTEITQQGLTEALMDIVHSSPDRLQEMGRRGQSLVCAGYSWPRIAPRTLALYEWLLHQGSRPDFVVID